MRTCVHTHTRARALSLLLISFKNSGSRPRAAGFDVETARFLPASPRSPGTSHKGPRPEGGAGRLACRVPRARPPLTRQPAPREQAAAGARAQVPAEPVAALLTIETGAIFSPEHGERVKGLSRRGAFSARRPLRARTRLSAGQSLAQPRDPLAHSRCADTAALQGRDGRAGLWAQRRARSRRALTRPGSWRLGRSAALRVRERGAPLPLGLSAPLKAWGGAGRRTVNSHSHPVFMPPTALVLKTTDRQVDALNGPTTPGPANGVWPSCCPRGSPSPQDGW